MMEWKKMKLKCFIEFPPKITLKKGYEYDYVAMEHINSEERFPLVNTKRDYDGSGSKFENGDVLFARITPCLENKKIAQVKGLENGQGFGSSEFFVFREKENISDQDFIYFLAKSNLIVQNAINSMYGASGRQRADKDFVENLEINVPALPIQKKIATTLSTYDNLIENNQKRIAILEKMAQNLYQEWFVRFRFPDWEKVEFVEELPKGWEKKRVKSFGKVVTGKTPSTKVEDNFGGDIPFIKTPDMHGNMFIFHTKDTLSKTGFNSQKSLTLPANSICVNCIGALSGSVSITTKVSQTNQQIHSIIPNESVNIEFLYFAVKALKPKIILFGNTGSTMTNLSKGKFENLKIIVPDEKTMEKFNKICSSIFTQIKALKKKENLLKQTRDRLLPRLLSGKLKV